MAISESFYSRLVAWLKVLLPLAALAILSTVFVIARRPEVESTIPFAVIQERGIEAEEKLGNPSFFGVTSDGAAVTLRAAEVRPKPGAPQTFLADGLTGRSETDTGRVFEAEARDGEVDLAADIARLSGSVAVTTSDGFRIDAQALTSRLDRTLAETDGPVEGQAPFGRIAAGGLTFTTGPAGGYLLVFNGGVKLVYEPKS